MATMPQKHISKLQTQDKLPVPSGGVHADNGGAKAIDIVRRSVKGARLGVLGFPSPLVFALLQDTADVGAETSLQVAKVRGVHITLAEALLRKVEDICLLLRRGVPTMQALNCHCHLTCARVTT